MTNEALGKLAFETYAKEHRSLMSWEDMGPECQAAWKAAVTAVIDANRCAEGWAAHHAGYQAEAAAKRAATPQPSVFYINGPHGVGIVCPHCQRTLESAGFSYSESLFHRHGSCPNSGKRFKRPMLALEEIH